LRHQLKKIQEEEYQYYHLICLPKHIKDARKRQIAGGRGNGVGEMGRR